MGCELPISEEHKRNTDSESNSHIPKVELIDVHPSSPHFFRCLDLLEASWLEVNGVDISEIKHSDKVPEYKDSELIFYWYKDMGVKLRAALVDDVAQGLLVYGQVLTGILSVRMLYLNKEYRLLNLGKRLLSSVPGTDNLIFQTVKDKPPELVFKLANGRCNLINEDEKLKTWLMPWRV